MSGGGWFVDVMDLRRRLMAQMAGGKPRSVSGEFTASGAITQNIVHNLGTRKIVAVAQRVNENHGNIDETATRYRSLMVFGLTHEVLSLDTQQSYSYNGGNQVSFADSGTGNTYPSFIYAYFPSATDTFLANSAGSRPDRGISAVSDNEIQITAFYGLQPGRWVYTIYALD